MFFKKKNLITLKNLNYWILKIRIEKFVIVAAQSLCRINNAEDANKSPFPQSIIVQRGLNKVRINMFANYRISFFKFLAES